MNADRMVLIPAAIALALIAAPVNAGQTEAAAAGNLPSAREVVGRHVAAIGGERAFLERTSLRINAKIEGGTMGQGQLKILLKAPDKSRQEARFDNGLSMMFGFDGETGWSVNPMIGPRLSDATQTKWLKHDGSLYHELHRPSDVRSMKVVGRTEFEGSTCYELVVTWADGLVFQEYFDVDSGLWLGYEFAHGPPSGHSTVLARSDYRDFDGIKLATRFRNRTGPEESLISVTDVQWDGVEDSEIAPADTIKALLDRKTNP